ncbi:hypothetical protein ETAA8_47720 [Anatilimnocola aggregata]|uniref:Uncharacterized protein n=1 Tax=Anatilimnocola aggregata TaxID=2528021 RepID=A0A517YHE4_9BACT|nr:hypothetical protein [Anatilimnocola aggregata]QDU29657.1 hypothetical protein ETAA8_47720 [Anatilimnocola aggregata]
MAANDSIQVNDELFRQNWVQFVRHPASEAVRDELGNSFALCLFGWGILLIAGVIMLVSIRWARDGLKCLWSFLTFEPFTGMRENPDQQPGLYQPLLAHGIIIGPDQKHALALGTFRPTSEYSIDALAKLASSLGELYEEGSEDPAYAEIYGLLRDDHYRPYRRRKLPLATTDEDLWLLDVELDLNNVQETRFGTILIAMVAKIGASGPIAQLPWAVADSAVKMA